MLSCLVRVTLGFLRRRSLNLRVMRFWLGLVHVAYVLVTFTLT